MCHHIDTAKPENAVFQCSPRVLSVLYWAEARACSLAQTLPQCEARLRALSAVKALVGVRVLPPPPFESVAIVCPACSDLFVVSVGPLD